MRVEDRELMQAVLGHLKKGRRNAVRGRVLAMRLGLRNDRTIRLAIRELIARGYPVASSVAEPMGFYLVETKDEAEEYLQVLKSRLVEDAYRRRDFKRAMDMILRPMQMKLL